MKNKEQKSSDKRMEDDSNSMEFINGHTGKLAETDVKYWQEILEAENGKGNPCGEKEDKCIDMEEKL